MMKSSVFLRTFKLKGNKLPQRSIEAFFAFYKYA